MRKSFTLFIFPALIALLVLGLYQKAEASTLVKVGKFWVGKSFYVTNNRKMDMDVAPYIDNNSCTMVPLRFLSYALGALDKDVFWDDSNQIAIITYKGIVLKFTVGSDSYMVNGINKTMDTKPILQSGRVFLPIRYVVEALGYEVLWDGDAQTVTVVPHGESKAPSMAPDMNDQGEPVKIVPDWARMTLKPEPVRVIESALGITLNWNGSNNWKLQKNNWEVNYECGANSEDYIDRGNKKIISFTFWPRYTTVYKRDYPGLSDVDISIYKPIIAAYFPNDIDEIYDNVVKY